MPYLSRTWLYAGKFYGPGEAELPDEVAAALEAKGAFLATPAAPTGGDAHTLTPEGEPPLPADLLQKLAAAGYTSGEAVALASDADLLAVRGIGRAALRDIRAAYRGTSDADSE